MSFCNAWCTFRNFFSVSCCTLQFEGENAIQHTLILSSNIGVAATKDHDIGTTNLHIEVSDVVNILVYVGIAKGNGVLSKSGKGKLIVRGVDGLNDPPLLKLTLFF